ncbi:DNA-processing protein DprA [Nonomuraea sp. NPDC049695]|uniref:DNA-processing protein DprA n=1 Tax=Nonomuraea sp. NPDC049695 TaxID=3154734 RepID=UPI003444E4F9
MSDQDLFAPLILQRIADPEDRRLGHLVAQLTPAGAVEALRSSASLVQYAPPMHDDSDEERWAKACRRWRSRLVTANPEADLQAGHELGADLVTPSDPDWPAELNDLGVSAPHALWVQGKAPLAGAFSRSVAIVGSRAATSYGRHAATEFAAAVGEAGLSVVSGAALGVDTAAHQGALLTDAPTIAVLACGVDIAYPQANRALLEQIQQRGAVVSEYPIGSQPSRARFLARNRLVASSLATLVVEAATRSGTMNTATRARELDRVLAAVPGPVTSSQSHGSNDLLVDRNAHAVRHPLHLLSLLQA